MFKKTIIFAALLASLALSGCGLKGDLYMPGQDPHEAAPQEPAAR